MDWQRYKALCDTPNVCSRWLLLQTLELVRDDALAARLRDHLTGEPLPKPTDHRGAAETDMFPMSLELHEVRAVRALVEQAAGRGVTTSGTRSRGLGGFVEAWLEYERYLERRPGADRGAAPAGTSTCSPRS
jgi:hypothetical protein